MNKWGNRTLLAMSVFASVASAAVVEPELMRALRSNAPGALTVVVHLQGQYDLKQFKGTFADQKARGLALANVLEAYTAKSSERLVSFLSSRTNDGVEEVTPIWITNSVRVRAPKAIIEKMIAMNGIELLQLDRGRDASELDDFVPASFKQAAKYTDGGTGWGVEKLRAPELWAQGIDGRGVLVAVIDSGAALLHPDLVNRLWRNPGEMGKDANGKDKSNNGVDDDSNGYVDDVVGWNFEKKSNNPTDDNGHGSQTAGIVGGDGTGGTRTGVAPRTSMMILKSCCGTSNQVFESNTWEAMQYAVKNGAKAISMSLSAKHPSNPTYNKWRRASEVVLVGEVIHINSAGNRGGGSEPHNIGAPASNPPAWFHASQTTGGLTSMITIGATDQNDKLHYYSSLGPVTWENISEFGDYPYEKGNKPGLIKPDVCGPAGVPSTSMDGKSYTQDFGGTSAATPHIGGVVALLLTVNKNLSPAQVTETFQSTALQVDSVFNNKCGAGRVDPVAAVEFVKRRFGISE